MNLAELAPAIMAAAALITALGGVLLNRRGQSNERVESAKAAALEERKQRFSESEADVSRAREAERLERERGEREKARADAADERARSAEQARLDCERERWTDRAQCDAAQRHSREAISALTDVVRNEVAREAGELAVDQIDEHYHHQDERRGVQRPIDFEDRRKDRTDG